MSRRGSGPRFYGVATRTGGGVFNTWDEVLCFLKKHPGAEYHKRFTVKPEAEEFVATRMQELTGDSVNAPVTQTYGSSEDAVPTPREVAVTEEDDDDLPPW